MSENIKIPLALLYQIIYLLDNIEIFNYCEAVQSDYDNVLYALNKKKASLELRDAYADIIKAKSDDARHQAKMRYLQQKRALQEDW